MLYPSLFDSFFAPTRVIVVSEERLQAAERKAKQEQIEAVESRINDLTNYRDELTAQLKELTPASSKPGKDLDSLDRVPESLEEALAGG
jgi:phosphopantetheine adenylyltransferase